MTHENGKRSFPTRRDFLSLGIGAFVVGTLPLAVRGRRKLVRRTLPIMGTLGEIGVVHRDERYAQEAMDAAFQELRRVEALLTRFRDDSDVGRVNRAPLRTPQGVSPETAQLLRESLRWAEASGGEFDPCLARAVALWDVGNRSTPPGVEEFQRYAGRGLHRYLEVGSSGGENVVLLHQEEMGVDLGGIGKGYGVDRAVEVLRSWGIRDALVNLGGDLYAMGGSEDGDPWKVGVRSPDHPDRLAATLPMRDRAVATSGDYQSYFDFGGRRYHHLLDPETGAPSRGRTRSVTVAAERCTEADAGATTAFLVAPEGVAAIFSRVAPGAEVVHSV